MAVVSTYSSVITNTEAVPRVLSNANLAKGTLLEAVGKVEGVSGDSIASKYFFCQIPSNARISRVLLSCDAVATSGAMDIGIYQTAENGGAVVDVDYFASAQVVTTALVNSDVTHEADAADAGAGYGLSDTEKMLWQGLGLSADPGRDYYVVGTLTTALGGAGTIVLKVQYAV